MLVKLGIFVVRGWSGMEKRVRIVLKFGLMFGSIQWSLLERAKTGKISPALALRFFRGLAE
jgi:hypothetical protein